jgi:uncharacterized protein YjaZ
MKCLLLAICVACCVVRAADASVGSCPIFNTADEFVALAHRAETMPPMAQIAAFHVTILSKFKYLYTDGVLGIKDKGDLDKLAVEELARIQKDGFASEVIAKQLMQLFQNFIAQFQSTYPDFECNFPIYMIDSLGRLDGAGRMVRGHPALVIGIDTIAQYSKPERIPILIAHELFHRYHYQAAGFSDDLNDRQPIWRTLWAEGLATYMSEQFNRQSQLSDVLLSRDLAERAPPLIGQLAMGLQNNGAPNPRLFAEYFRANSAAARTERIPPRSGYYVGYRVAMLAAQHHNMSELAHLHGSSLRREINSYLSELSGGNMALQRTPEPQR